MVHAFVVNNASYDFTSHGQILASRHFERKVPRVEFQLYEASGQKFASDFPKLAIHE
ncbi:hypothetical protein VCR20J5_630024 [Vibrio crassostreae]|nr:hypothetical protein VCR20J5_630024 [Vibrio crassostreae]